MPQTTPLNPQQQWMYRHRRGVRIACTVFFLFLIGEAIYDFTQHQIVEGVISIGLCGSPLILVLITRSLERTVAIRDGHDASSRPGTS